MAKKQSTFPYIAGGRTLASCRRKGKDGGGTKKNKRARWYQLNQKIYGEQAKMESWPQGEMPADVAARLAPGGSK